MTTHTDPCLHVTARDITARCGADCATGWVVCPDHLDEAGIDPDDYYERTRDDAHD